jgi:hypothetical protein
MRQITLRERGGREAMGLPLNELAAIVQARLALAKYGKSINDAAGLRLPADAQVLAGSSMVSQWAGSDPQAASAWVASLPEGETRDQLFANLMNRWAKTDPSAAATWLQTVAASPSRDAAVSAFTSRIVSADPQGAVQWAATISDASIRDTETKAAIQTWFEADPASASTWLASSGLPEEIKAQFLPPQN